MAAPAQCPWRVVDDDFTIKLTRDQAFVLSDWLYWIIGPPVFDNLVDEERAVGSPRYRIAGPLKTSLVEVFMPDYSDRLHSARERLLDSLGEIGWPPAEQQAARLPAASSAAVRARNSMW